MRSRILFVSGHRDDARQITRMLHALPVMLDHAGSLQQARAELRRDDYDVLLTEATLPDGNWRDALHRYRLPRCGQVILQAATDWNREADRRQEESGCRTTSNSNFSNSMISVRTPERLCHHLSGSNSE